MTQRKADKGLDFETLRLAIERCDPDLVLGFYAEDARAEHRQRRRPARLSLRASREGGDRQAPASGLRPGRRLTASSRRYIGEEDG